MDRETPPMADVVERLPERIWVERDEETNEKRWFSVQGMGVEYIRADRARLSQAGAGECCDGYEAQIAVLQQVIKDRDATIAALAPSPSAEGLPAIPQDDADFTPELARKIIVGYQRLLRTTPPATPAQPNASVEAVDLHDFITHRRAWRQALEMALAASDSMETAEYWNHEVKAFDRAFDLIAPIASLTPAPTQGDGPQLRGIPFEQFWGEISREERERIRSTDLHKKGDTVLVWVNEGDLYHPTPSAPVSAPSPAGGVREALQKLLDHPTNAEVIASASAALSSPATPEPEASLYHKTGERITRKDLNNAYRSGQENGRMAAHLLDGVATPEPVSAPANGEVVETDFDELIRIAVEAVSNLDDWTNVNETEFTGWGDGEVPPGAVFWRIKSGQALKALRDLASHRHNSNQAVG